MIQNLTLTGKDKREMAAYLTHYILNLPVPDDYVIQARFNWAACNYEDKEYFGGAVLMQAFPYVPSLT